MDNTERISTRQYCPTRKVPLDIQEILIQQVQLEDELNHTGQQPTEIPKFEKVKVKKGVHWWTNFFKDLLLNNARQLIP